MKEQGRRGRKSMGGRRWYNRSLGSLPSISERHISAGCTISPCTWRSMPRWPWTRQTRLLQFRHVLETIHRANGWLNSMDMETEGNCPEPLSPIRWSTERRGDHWGKFPKTWRVTITSHLYTSSMPARIFQYITGPQAHFESGGQVSLGSEIK